MPAGLGAGSTPPPGRPLCWPVWAFIKPRLRPTEVSPDLGCVLRLSRGICSQVSGLPEFGQVTGVGGPAPAIRKSLGGHLKGVLDRGARRAVFGEPVRNPPSEQPCWPSQGCSATEPVRQRRELPYVEQIAEIFACPTLG